MAFDIRNQVAARHKTGYTFRGQEICLVKKHGFPRKGLWVKGLERGIIPTDKQIEIASVYAVTGDFEKTAELSKVPIQFVRKFAKTEEFKSLVKEIREENSEKFAARFAEIIEKTQNAIIDRLENGDVVVTKDGKEYRIPVKSRDLTLIQAIAFDKLQLLRGKPTSRSESIGNTSRLEALAEQFIKLAHKATNKRLPEVVDAEVVSETKNEPTTT